MRVLLSKSKKMYSDYKDENIQFANRILNHREELSEEEVKQWLELTENRQLLDELAAVKRTLRQADFSQQKFGVFRSLEKEITGKRIQMRRWWMSVAAIVICSVGLGMWFWLPVSEIQIAENNPQLSDIRPGSARAQLVLAGGESIALGNKSTRIETTAVTGIINDSANGLNYSGVAVKGQVETEYNTLRVPVGGFYKLELADGTKVWLNAASELKFPVQFNGPKREVFLKGEGYFQVAHDPEHKFVVHLKNSEVTVLGTVFNINAYEEEENVYTTLAEGSVAFYSQQQQRQVILKPGMQGVMDIKDGTMSVSEVDPSLYSAWVEGRFVFRAMDLEMIMRQLERWYDCEIFYQNPQAKKYEFRGVISRDMEIRQVLDIIEETTDLKFDIKGRTIMVKKGGLK